MIRHIKRHKRKNQIKHAKRRFAQRCDISVSDEDLNKMVLDIQKQNAIFVKKESNRVSLWNVTHLGKEYKVLYDKQRKSIVTVLEFENERL